MQIQQGPPDSWHYNVSVAASSFSRVYAKFREALVFGVTIISPGLEVSTMESWITLKGERISVSLAAATIGAFRVKPNSTNTSAYSAVAVIASISSTPVTFVLSLLSAGWGGGLSTLYDGASGAVLQEWPASPHAINGTIQESCGVRVLVVQDARVPGPRRGAAMH